MLTQDVTRETLRKLREDDLARRAVLRFQQDPSYLNNTTDATVRLLQKVAADLMTRSKEPKTLGEWLALDLFYGHMPCVRQMQQRAAADQDPVYMRAETWLNLIASTR